MPSTRSVLVLALLFAAWLPAPGQEQASRILFTGDILLSRQVQREIEQTGRFPWAPFADLFRSATWVAGNLEGAVGQQQECLPALAENPCFAIAPQLVPLLAQAGFRALSIANNHSADLGAAGIVATRSSLRDSGLDAISFDESPVFLTIGTYRVAIVAVSTVPARNGSRERIPSIAMRQKLQLARTLSELVIVSVHWGSELLDWPSDEQRTAAAWLVANGADLLVGHHPHVVQPAECVAGRPVYYSLGNHLFDQKYPATKVGLIADCTIRAGVLRCGGLSTATPPGSAMPQFALDNAPEAQRTLAACPVALPSAVTVNGFALRGQTVNTASDRGYLIEATREGARAWRSQSLALVSAETGRLAGPNGPEFLLALERHLSPLDNEDGVRPYVYEARPGGLVARWRGSALAWPLLDAALLPNGGGLLCALHRSDSFLVLKTESIGVRTAAYRWNGFGFSGVDDPDVLTRCEGLFGSFQ